MIQLTNLNDIIGKELKSVQKNHSFQLDFMDNTFIKFVPISESGFHEIKVNCDDFLDVSQEGCNKPATIIGAVIKNQQVIITFMKNIGTNLKNRELEPTHKEISTKYIRAVEFDTDNCFVEYDAWVIVDKVKS